MSADPCAPLTQLLAQVRAGDGAARDRLWHLVYEDLRHVAHRQMAAERSADTLQTTVLVHEAYLRLGGGQNADWSNRRHFFAAAAEAMRRILVDYARKKGSLKRGAGRVQATFAAEPAAPASSDGDATDLLDLDEALTRLEQIAPRQSEVVKLRHFAGLTVEDAALALEVSPRTVESDWRLARAWLHRELNRDR